ncbi:probable D-erythrose 4-phosphate dehydrogenase [Desulfotalea psychrophila LSv54]|uniref:Probable D-erythrose 4-phosphate dehydrogenase n=1 Tax=Desulfotalea psychrophila (strain LSv54 / DSM 12343) TaxID=177439 RepID=Q6ALS4_DESPS|nr:probable D-erythrose 4-phosphate dehydrogenase [Desulfotalea psychrophila LSv54]
MHYCQSLQMGCLLLFFAVVRIAVSFRIAINGYGRIGQSVLRALYTSEVGKHFKVVAINELADIETIRYLTKYDTTHGRFPLPISSENGCLIVNDDRIEIFREKDPRMLPWKELDIDLVFECSGSFHDRETAELHLASGAKRILISHPSCKEVDATVVFGINEGLLKPAHRVVSNASCTTNCILPVLHLLEKNFGVENGLITTVHSAMNDQPVIDSYHNTNLRLTRSALQSIVPVDTGLSNGLQTIYPAFKGKFQCLHLRVPTINVSLMDLSVNLKENVSVEDINNLFAGVAKRELQGLLGYTRETHASVDFNTDSRSCVVDGTQTRVCGGKLVKMICWFDNEWGFANRMVDVAGHWLTL